MTQLFDPSSISYYDNNYARFIAGTLNVDMSGLYREFLKHIPSGGRILDLGCGSGRDSKFFVEQSYKVVALDASIKMVAATNNIVKADVRQMRFDEMDFDNEFDGIWACASLLHVPITALSGIWRNCLRALRVDGAMYASFKYGTSERMIDGRLFNDLDENILEGITNETGYDFSISHWITFDARPERASEKWLNAIVKRE